MVRMMYVAGLASVLAAWLLPVSVGGCETPTPSEVQWDDVGQTGSLIGEVALMGPEESPPDGMLGPKPGMRRPGGPGAGMMGPGRGMLGPGVAPHQQKPPCDGDKDRHQSPPPGEGPAMLGPGGMPGGMLGGMPGGPMGPGMAMPNGPQGPMGFMPPDPEMRELLIKDGQLDRDACRLAEQYRRATSETREKIKKEVEETVAKQFEVRQQRRNLELRRLEEQLKDLREAVDKREKARKELIDKRVSRLLGIEKELDF